jgi:hypothetical protein
MAKRTRDTVMLLTIGVIAVVLVLGADANIGAVMAQILTAN